MRLLILSLSLVFSLLCFAQKRVYKTEPLSEDIYTIQVNANGNWQSLPLIRLNSDDYVRINFDRLGEAAYNRLRYRLIHCNADWTVSGISEIDYLDGFNDNYIDDYAQSVNTSVEYNNFSIDLPNEKARLKVSGNYVVEVYEEDKPDKLLMTACFSVLDSQVLVTGQYSSNTDIDSNKQHQQVSFAVDYSGINIRDVFNDLKVYVRQNNRLDDMRKLDKPTRMQANKILYEHDRNLIFEAGNEFRRFETGDVTYNGLSVEAIEYVRPYYYATLRDAKPRAGKSYVYDQDQNGRFVIRNLRGQDNDIDADYFIVNFVLGASQLYASPIYLNGDFSCNSFSDKYKMTYDPEKQIYYASLLMKQGAYNYQYLTKTADKYTASTVEGNYYETKNEYCVFVYHRPMGVRGDYLIGILLISDK